AATRPAATESPRKQMQDPLLMAELDAIKKGQATLKQESDALRAGLERSEKRAQQERAEQKRFQEMMSTNFDLLEKSVAASLASAMEKAAEKAGTHAGAAPAAPVGAVAAPAAAPVAVSVPKAAVAPASGALAPVAAATAPEPTRKVTLAPKGRKAAAAAASAASSRPAEPALSDPDLKPPAKPRALAGNPAAKPLYERGFAFFARQDYARAIETYQEFLAKFPSDVYSDNAQFWIGEANLALGRHAEAEAAYRRVLRDYDHRSTVEGYKTPDAIYRLGVTFLKRNDERRAEFYFANVSERFPESSAALKAKRELATLRQNTAGGLVRPLDSES
ncbi:MAG: tetratricopeptide repeat protein, partial [Candidatus Lambdaproteobacteria bacterium]|nr:tetratricopeptide repeat protein [Candidatus Lambdaproteobacteria bacterium]